MGEAKHPKHRRGLSFLLLPTIIVHIDGLSNAVCGIFSRHCKKNRGEPHDYYSGEQPE